MVARKASVQLGRPVTVKAVDVSAAPVKNKNMDALLSFGKEHPDIVKIKNN
jgi:hypothetical protein